MLINIIKIWKYILLLLTHSTFTQFYELDYDVVYPQSNE